jgi:hypothetical protein
LTEQKSILVERLEGNFWPLITVVLVANPGKPMFFEKKAKKGFTRLFTPMKGVQFACSLRL